MLVLLLASLLLDGLKDRPNTHKSPAGAALQPVMSVDVALGTPVLTKVAHGDASSLTTEFSLSNLTPQLSQ